MSNTGIKIRILCAALVLAAVCSALAGCAATGRPESGKPSVVVTVFPIYDWVRQIAGDKVDITLLLDNGIDLHSYQPTAEDVVTISTADLFICVGGASDFWVSDVISRANGDVVSLNLIESLGDRAKEEELKEGMQAEDEEEDGAEYDEHIWLSLKNASLLCGVITEKLCEADPGDADLFRKSCEKYKEELDALDGEYEKTVAGSRFKTVLFGDRYPFRYLTDDYGIDYYAAYAGCSAESEASFETVAFLAAKVDELDLPAIMQIETSDGRLARTVRDATENKDQKILTLDSMQSSVKDDVDGGKSYLETMKKNLEVLKEALN